MFLPSTSDKGKQKLSQVDFVRSQFIHYGVQFDEKQFSGKGTLLLRKMLRAGKLDQVPDHIKQIEAQLHAEWLDRRSVQQLLAAREEKFMVEKYFRDTNKTTKPFGISYKLSDHPSQWRLYDAVNKTNGLHYCAHDNLSTEIRTIFLGWNKNEVEEAARNYGLAEEEEELARGAEAETREQVTEENRDVEIIDLG
ncbi:hypothetical protein QBC38DRAFT_495117 [Podospora fimiseda]|uniref:Uncharacterized protein n=1 Tax=Podospora fimiseda TaxID=252190 RepID=A0AAN7H5H8_9PEZI|nr:hypothetical protein QBC38DRAFT_495117 [Podospora fimiseda]